jgi:hypothetical protein
MQTSKATPRKPRSDADGFDVTVEHVVGSVSFTAGGDHPHVTAFRIIADADEDGVYRFPREDGSMQKVTVETVLPGIAGEA